jgi:predicted nucleotidyltransferase
VEAKVMIEQNIALPQDEISEILGRPVDLNTSGFLSRHFRQNVLDTALVIYET